MNYSDYSHYFQQLVSNQNTIINIQNNIITYLEVFLFVFVCYFLWRFISNSIKGRC